MKKCIIFSLCLIFPLLCSTFFSCSKSTGTETDTTGIKTFSAGWLKVKSLPVTVPSDTGRMFGVAFTIGDSAAYVGMGGNGKNPDSLFDDFYKYSVATDTWQKIANLQVNGISVQRKGAVAFSLNGKGYVGTGLDKNENFYNDFYCYDPSTDKWTKIAGLPGPPRARATAFSLNGKGYVIGGATSNNTYLSDAYVYEPSTNVWSEIESLPDSRRAAASSFAINGKGYVIGGWDGNGLTADILQFDPVSTPHWSSVMEIDTGLYTHASIERVDGIALPIGNSVYFVSGALSGGNSFFNGEATPNLTSWKWDLSSDSWSKGPDFPQQGRWGALGFVLQNKGFVGTGTRNTTVFGNFYELKF